MHAMNRLLYLSLISTLAVVTFVARWERFKGTEPRIDQANFATSVRGIVEANHGWPEKHGTQSFSQTLLGDEGSLLYQIGHPIFNNPQSCFNLVPLLVSSVVCRLFSYSYADLVFLSILATCLCLFPLGYLPFVAFRKIEGQSFPLGMIGLGTALVYALTFQVSLFSPWGVHNAGVFFLVIAIAGSVWILRDSVSWEYVPVRPMLLILLFCGVACYSHWTNVFLLLPALVISLLTIREMSFRRRAALATVLTLLMGGILLPIGILAAVLHRADNNFLVYMNFGNSPWIVLRGIPGRALKWFSAGCELFSPAGLLLGIAGLVWIARQYRISLPLICLAIHFLAYCLIPGFIWNGSPTWLRTYNYVFPLLSIGMGAMLALVWRGLRGGAWTVVGRLIVGAFFLLHISQQIPQLRSAEWLHNRRPDFYSNYLAGQGDLRPTVAGLEGAIPEGEQILFWDYPLRQLYQSLARSSGRNPIIASTITSRLSEVDTRTRFNESPRTLPANMHVVTPGTVSPRELENALLTILRMAGVNDVRGVSLSPRGRWDTNAYGTIVLYDVQRI
jgi:hypothetical protein